MAKPYKYPPWVANATITIATAPIPIPTPINILRVVCDFVVNCLTETTSSKAICPSRLRASTNVKLEFDTVPLAPRNLCLFLRRTSMFVPIGMPTIWVLTLAVSGAPEAKPVSMTKAKTRDTVRRMRLPIQRRSSRIQGNRYPLHYRTLFVYFPGELLR